MDEKKTETTSEDPKIHESDAAESGIRSGALKEKRPQGSDNDANRGRFSHKEKGSDSSSNEE